MAGTSMFFTGDSSILRIGNTLFHWHVEDSGMNHVYIKPMTP